MRAATASQADRLHYLDERIVRLLDGVQRIEIGLTRLAARWE